MRKIICAIGLVGLLCGSAQAADVVQLKNGDKISGTVIKLEGGTLIMKTDYAKEVRVDWSEVAALETQTAARVALTSGDAIIGRFVRKADGTYLQAENLVGMRPVKLEDVESVAVPEAVWNGLVALAVLGTAGNTQSTGVGGRAEIQRTTKRDRMKFSVRTDYQDRERQLTVQNTLGRARYDYNLTDDWFLAVFAELEHDHFKDLRLRSRAGAGPGYRFIHTPDILLTALVGLAYTNEDFNDTPDRDYVTAVAIQDFSWKLTGTQLLYETLEIYPSLQRASDFSIRAEAGYRQSVVAGIFADLGVIDEYNHNPAAGKKSNDFRYALTLGYQF